MWNRMITLPENLLLELLKAGNIYCTKEKNFCEAVNSTLTKNKCIYKTELGLNGRNAYSYKTLNILSRKGNISADFVLRKKDSGHPIVSDRTLLPRIPKSPKIYLDFTFWDNMKEDEKNSAIDQTIRASGIIKREYYLSNCVYTNVNKEAINKFEKAMFKPYKLSNLPQNPENTVVLDPYSKHEFRMDYSKNYVVLSLVDKGNRLKGTSSTFAEELGAQTMSLSTRKVVNITIDQTVAFLCKAIRGNTENALQEVLPKRKKKLLNNVN